MESIWSKEITWNRRDILPSGLTADAAVIGAGMAGINIAYFLIRAGVRTVVLEGSSIADGETKKTTAKITSQHRLIYDKLISQIGMERAGQYALANEWAIKQYEEIIQKNKIDCSFEKLSSYVYSLTNEEVIMKETDAAHRLGIQAGMVKNSGLPFEIKAGVKFLDQAQFNPLAYIRKISEPMEIYESTFVQAIEKNTIHTNKGKVKAENIIIATHYPLINVNGLYFVRLHQERSYVLALEGANDVGGMYIDEAQGGLSFRNYDNLLLVGGGSHRTGTFGGSNITVYEQLNMKAREYYPKCAEITHWSAQDVMTIDGVPCIGKLTSHTPNLYVATGFNKWGMTGSMVSAGIISDAILGRKNEFAEVFHPQRFYAKASVKRLFTNLKFTVKGQLCNLKPVHLKTNSKRTLLDRLKPGDAAIVRLNGKRIGAYREEADGQYEDTIHTVLVKCPHLGCSLHWNKNDFSWECACHGSRFDYKGNLINNPSLKHIIKE